MDAEPHRLLRIAVLGPLEARRSGTPLDLGPVMRKAVLAPLVLRANTQVSHEQLLDDVWDARHPGSGRRVLPSHIYPLRKALDAEGTTHTDSVIRSGKGWYRFVSSQAHLDVTELDELAEEARRAEASGDLAAAEDLFSRAIALFRGEPLAGLPGPFARAERERLSGRRRALRSERLGCLVLLGRSADAVDDAAALSASDPYDESLLALHMRALYGGERQAEALNIYEGMRERLRDELGVDPGEELRRVHEAVLRRDDGHLLGPAAARTARPRTRRAVNQLPGDTGHLTGREGQLKVLTASPPPESVSVVAVDGTAGVGKTALVVRAAREIGAHFPDGCLFVDLRAHSAEEQRLAPQRVLRRLLRSIGADDSEVPSDDLDELVTLWRTATSRLRLLLVLDDALGAQQVRPLLPAGPGSMVMVAGRQRLAGLDADRRVTLDALGTADSAALLRHILGKERTDPEPEAIRDLVRLCDGLPLALRIAGTRLQTRPSWTVAHLVGRMAGDEQRLSELSAGDRSVEAAFRLSYDQLPPSRQHGFRTLGLTPTVEFDVLTPAAMLGRPRGETEQILESLVDTSLLQQHRPGRYRLHDLVRVHARRLAATSPAEAGAARTAALRLYLDAGRIASEWGVGGFPTGPQPAGAPFTGWKDATVWLDAAGGELADVVGHAAAAGEADHACWIAEGLTDYFIGRGRYHECQIALETALAHVDGAADRRMAPALRNCIGLTCMYRARYPEAVTWLREARDLSRERGDRHEEARALVGLGAFGWLGTDGPGTGPAGHDRAATRLTEALELAQQVGDDWLVAMALGTLGFIHHHQGRSEEALDCFRTAHTRGRAIGRSRVIRRALTTVIDLHLTLLPREAGVLLRQVADLMQRAGDVELHTLALARLGTAAHDEGDLGAAAAIYLRALAQHRPLSAPGEPDNVRLEMDLRCRLGRTYLAAGRVSEAREQFRTALALPGADRNPKELAQARAGAAAGSE
ncbi:BTAD domain-containing putative transcriptional regulator [Streptomyces sp. NPDC060209]|uniref:AfsR/SARP family transcriptional regulator n=1 Tax=Streptomyces sp. NPDC060209 TaxID=3347073 RepID=UPI00365651F3